MIEAHSEAGRARLAPLPAPPRAAGGAVERADVGGLAWTFRTSFGHRLRQVAGTAWSDPAGQGWKRIKRNAARMVWRAEIEGKAYFLKYYFEDRLGPAIKRLLRGPACEAEFRIGLAAMGAGISAVRPAACCRSVRCENRRCSLLVTEALEPTYPLNEFWATLQSDEQPARRRSDCAALTDRLAQMIAQAHQAGFEHTDMHAANHTGARGGRSAVPHGVRGHSECACAFCRARGGCCPKSRAVEPVVSLAQQRVGSLAVPATVLALA